MEPIFTEIYEKNVWGDNNSYIYRGSSGTGSSVEYCKNYIPFLREFIKTHNIKSVVDLGCGDGRTLKVIYDDLDVKYTGYDAYRDVIVNNKLTHAEKYIFNHLDFFTFKEYINGGELCILKDVIQHWSLADIKIFMDYIISSKKFKYIMVNNCACQTIDNADCVTEGCRSLSCKFEPLKGYGFKEIFIIL